jgi:hypothetical protein
LISTESISQKKCDSSAQYRTCDNDKAEFWPCNLDFVHKSKIWGEGSIVSSIQSVKSRAGLFTGKTVLRFFRDVQDFHPGSG